MNNHIILHIGTHKTGSTSIQHALTSAICANNDSVYLPKAFYKSPFLNESFPLCHPLLACYSEESSFEYKSNQIPRNISQKEFKLKLFNRAHKELIRLNKKTVILSHEALFNGLQDYQCRELCNFLRKYCEKLTVILYLRHPKFYLSSWISQDVKNGGCSILQGKELQSCHGQGAFYYSSLKKWSDAVGDQSDFVIRLFDDEYLTGKDVIEDFSENLGLTMQRAETNINTSLTISELKFLAYLNNFLPGADNIAQRDKDLRPILKYLSDVSNLRKDNSEFELELEQGFQDALQADISKWSLEFFGSSDPVYNMD